MKFIFIVLHQSWGNITKPQFFKLVLYFGLLTPISQDYLTSENKAMKLIILGWPDHATSILNLFNVVLLSEIYFFLHTPINSPSFLRTVLASRISQKPVYKDDLTLQRAKDRPTKTNSTVLTMNQPSALGAQKREEQFQGQLPKGGNY